MPVRFGRARRKRPGFLAAKAGTDALARLYLLRLRDLLCARGVAFFLICGVSFCLFLRRLLVCGFRRFITHDPQVKIQDEQSQYGHLDDFTL
jgi:hypothetical protein